MNVILAVWLAMQICNQHTSWTSHRPWTAHHVHYTQGWKKCYAIKAQADKLEPRFLDEALTALEKLP